MKKTCIVLGILLMVSCQEKTDFVSEKGTAYEENRYAISVENALANLEAFMESADELGTKGYSFTQNISSVIPVKYNPTATKASPEDLDCENLLYIANFAKGEGYAILAADSRIEEKVIAVVDNGQLSDMTIYRILELSREKRPILKDYPTTGPGFFTTDQTGDEVFMNPNTVSLYDPAVGDTLVGNFCLDDTEVDKEIPTESIQTRGIPSAPELISGFLCVTYAINEIRTYDDRADEGSAIEESKRDTETSYSDWTVRKIVSPLLAKFAGWHQNSPFNDLYPKRRRYVIFGKKRRAPAGCFPLAIAKVMTHFEYPGTYRYNGCTIDWKELKNSYTTPVGRRSAAYLLKGISSGCKSLYFYEGTFTFPCNAISFMEAIGLHNVQKQKYSFERVTGMIDRGCPLIIYSLPNANIFKSHCWNIDGYKNQGAYDYNQTVHRRPRRDDNREKGSLQYGTLRFRMGRAMQRILCFRSVQTERPEYRTRLLQRLRTVYEL